MKDVRIRATQLCPECKGECMVTHRAFQSICGFCSGSGRSECELTLPMLKELLGGRPEACIDPIENGRFVRVDGHLVPLVQCTPDESGWRPA